MTTFQVKVSSDFSNIDHTYNVLSSSENDAILLAFALDGGLDELDKTIDQGHLELAKIYCEIIK